jgi:hypothetical protein
LPRGTASISTISSRSPVTATFGAAAASIASNSRRAIESGVPVTARPNIACCIALPGCVPSPNRIVGSSRFFNSSATSTSSVVPGFFTNGAAANNRSPSPSNDRTAGSTFAA